MKSKHNTLTCLFGHHDYSKRLTRDKDGDDVHLCKICKRSARCRGGWDADTGWYDYDEKGNCIHEKWEDGTEVWQGYDEKGNLVHLKWSGGIEVWREYDDEGNLIHEKWNDGDEYWYDKHGNRTREKHTQHVNLSFWPSRL